MTELNTSAKTTQAKSSMLVACLASSQLRMSGASSSLPAVCSDSIERILTKQDHGYRVSFIETGLRCKTNNHKNGLGNWQQRADRNEIRSGKMKLI